MTSPNWLFAIKENAKESSLEVVIYDVIGADFFHRGVLAADVLVALAANKTAKAIRVRMNSIGGIVTEAEAMRTALRERSAAGARVTVSIDGLAASAGTIVTDAGDEVTIAPGAYIMIHEASCGTPGRGTAGDHQKAADQVSKATENLVAMYVAASARRGKNKTADDFRGAMAKETYFTASEAVEWGLADRVIEDVRVAACADVTRLENAPQGLLEAYERIAARAQQPTTPAPPATTTPPSSDGTAVTQPPIEEKATMTEANPTNHISIARALELPAGATEQDAVAAAVRLRQLEVQVQALTGCASTAEGMGALRAMKLDADKFKTTEAELVTVKAERDLQNFEALIQRGISEKKLCEPAVQKLEREKFERKAKEGRGAEAVEELRGFLNVKAPDPRFSRDVQQPNAEGGSGTPLVHNGKTYEQLSYAQRAKLAKENPELWKLMKADHEAQTA